MVVKDSCALCGEAAATVTCQKCNQYHYCTEEHQDRHWECHKEQCLTFEERADPVCGRYLVAARDLQQGDLLFTETPVALGPLSSNKLLCLGCHEFLVGNDIFRCPGCWWPLCSLPCATSPLHREECPILARDTKHIGQPPCHENTGRYDIILSLRCLLLKSSNPEAWARVEAMASHAQRRVDDNDHTHITTVRYITQVLGEEFDEDDAHHVHDAIVTNCFEWRSPSMVSLRGVYTQMARMNHSCLPNITLNSDNKGTMSVRAAIDLKRGDKLSISYMGTAEPFWERQVYTLDAHFFSCDCVRCDDPTEMGLHYSSPKCENCRDQFLEPNAWLGKISWECPLCGAQESESTIRHQANEWLAWFETDDTFLKNSHYAVRSILDKVKDAFHDNHYVWVKAAQIAVRTLKGDQTVEGLNLRRNLWRRLLKIYDVLEPGLTRRRGVTLYELGVAEATLANAEMKAGKLTSYFYKRQMEEALGHFEDARKILDYEPLTSSERRWHTRSTEGVEKVKLDLLKDTKVESESQSTVKQERNVEVV